MSHTISAELLLETKVRDLKGQTVGRIEEIVAEQEGGDAFVREYHTGGFGFIEHLCALAFGSWVWRWFARRAHGYVIRWDQLDISDPSNPRLTCPRSELTSRHHR